MVITLNMNRLTKFFKRSHHVIPNLPISIHLPVVDSINHSPSWQNGTRIPIPLPGNMTSKQCDNILSLVSIAENSTINWYDNYTYIQDIGDGRGYTCNIVGFCSGTGDLLFFFQRIKEIDNKHPLVEFIPALQKINGTDSHEGCNGLINAIKKCKNDPVYIEATWKTIIFFYWMPVMVTANSLGIQWPITKGQLYDINLNMGNLSLVSKVKSIPPSRGGNELIWLIELQTIWHRHITQKDSTLNGGQPDRSLMWRSIRDSGNYYLKSPINVTCYGDVYEI